MAAGLPRAHLFDEEVARHAGQCRNRRQRAGEIPDYARSTAGVLEPTTVFYHRIAS